MKYFEIPIEIEKEEPAETMKYIESRRNWQVTSQTYKIPVEKECNIEATANLSQCKVYWRGDYLIVEHNDMVHYWDSFPYCYLKQAIEFMEPEKPAKWKTLDKLISLRMGIRQTEVNGCGYVNSILEGKKMTLTVYNKFMKLAREHDYQHHGSHTF